MLDKLPKISIITVCYNASTSIEKTIKSVFAQNYVHLEYIFVDAKSTDNTLEIIRKYQKDENLIISEKDKVQPTLEKAKKMGFKKIIF